MLCFIAVCFTVKLCHFRATLIALNTCPEKISSFYFCVQMAVPGISRRAVMTAKETREDGLAETWGQKEAVKQRSKHGENNPPVLPAPSPGAWWQPEQRWTKTPSWSSALLQPGLTQVLFCSFPPSPAAALPFPIWMLATKWAMLEHLALTDLFKPNPMPLSLPPLFCCPSTGTYCLVSLPAAQPQLHASWFGVWSKRCLDASCFFCSISPSWRP